jgi:hypothetical protein
MSANVTLWNIILIFSQITRIESETHSLTQVRRSKRFGNARLFSKWYDDLLKGKQVVVVAVSEAQPKNRNWIVTAYIASKITEGESEWKRS